MKIARADLAILRSVPGNALTPAELVVSVLDENRTCYIKKLTARELLALAADALELARRL